MYYSKNHTPSKNDKKKHWQSEIYRLKNEINTAKSFIIEAEEEIQQLEELVSSI